MKKILAWIAKYKTRIIYTFYAVVAIGICYWQQVLIKSQLVDDVSTWQDTTQKHTRGIISHVLQNSGIEASAYNNPRVKFWLYNPLEEWEAPSVLFVLFLLFGILYIGVIEPRQIDRQSKHFGKIEELQADIKKKDTEIEWEKGQNRSAAQENRDKATAISTLENNLSQSKTAYDAKCTEIITIKGQFVKALKAKDDDLKKKDEDYAATETEMSRIFAKKIFVLEKQVIALEEQLRGKKPPDENPPAPEDDNSM